MDLFRFDETTKEGKELFDRLKKLCSSEVLIGFQEGEATEKDGTDVAKIAIANEFGTSTIPARPFVRQTVENHREKIEKDLLTFASGLKKGSDPDEILDKCGQYMVGMMQMEIRDGAFVPNSPYTIMKKGSDHPLIDTGTMRKSIRYHIKKRGDAK